MILLVQTTVLFSQTEPKQITVRKVPVTDSVFFDNQEFALYSKTSGYINRFKTIKQCKFEYISKKKSGELILKKNHLPKDVTSLVKQLRCKKIELKFSDIVLLADSLNFSERKCPPLTITISKRRSFWLPIGPGRIPWPIPFYYIRTIK